MAVIQGLTAAKAMVDVLVDTSGQVYVVLSTVPLPTGASTEATQLLVKADLDDLVKALATVATDKLRVTLVDALPAGTNVIGHVDVDASALPSGAATETTLNNALTKLTSLSNALATVASDKLRVSVIDALPSGTNVLGHVILDAGTATIGRVQIRNNADGANIDPVAEGTFTGRLGEVQASPTANTVLDRLKALLTGIVLAAGSNRVGKVTVRNSADAADIDPLAEATFTGRIGEVQATPTQYTVLDRLKALLTGIVLAAGSAVIGKVDINTAPTLTVQATGGDKPLSITAVINEEVSNLNPGAGTINLDGATVPAGEIWVVTAAGIVNVNHAPTYGAVVQHGMADTIVAQSLTMAANTWLVWTGQTWYAAGANVRAIFAGTVAGDDLYLRYSGYKMKTP